MHKPCLHLEGYERKGVVEEDVIQSNPYIQNPLVSRDTITFGGSPLYQIVKGDKCQYALVCCLWISGLLFSANDINRLWRHFYALALTDGYKCSAWEGPGCYPFNPAPERLLLPTVPIFYLCNNARSPFLSPPVDLTLASRLFNTPWIRRVLLPGGTRSRPYTVSNAFCFPPLRRTPFSAQIIQRISSIQKPMYSRRVR